LGKPAKRNHGGAPEFHIDQYKDKEIDLHRDARSICSADTTNGTNRKNIIPASWCREKYQTQSGEYREACGSEQPWIEIKFIRETDKMDLASREIYPYPPPRSPS
jgi:hypothetical protein